MNLLKEPSSGRTAYHLLIIAAAVFALLAPFSAKAFHIDDPMYIWAARHIQSNPLDFYGFTVNWEGYEMAMPAVMKNPPGVSYLIALAASFLGWGEVPLHLFFMVQAFGAAAGTYFLARRFTASPLHAALFMIVTPVFVLTGTSLMSDMLMLAFYVWAVVLWIGGIERRRPLMLALAGVLIAFATLTKYPAMSLFPLLAAYALVKKEPIRLWLPWLVLPVLILGGYQWLTLELYGRPLIFDAVSYSGVAREKSGLTYPVKGLTGLFFAGGCFLTLFFFAPVILSKKALAVFIALFAAFFLMLYLMGSFVTLSFIIDGEARWWLMAQASLFAATGAGLITLAVSDLAGKREPAAILLFLWIIGTFVFSSFVNWSVNGRTMLPIAPALGIILMRRLDVKGARHMKKLIPLVPALIAALIVGAGDHSLASSARQAGRDLAQKHSDAGPAVWFQGHWGFQYYAQEGGGRTLDWEKTRLEAGDLVVIAINNYDYDLLPMERFEIVDEHEYEVFPYASTLYPPDGANFYSSLGGPLPYVFGSGYKETYIVVKAKDAYALTLKADLP